jgi:nucleotidyltransferase/DNA polymerase involved in DNA repair
MSLLASRPVTDVCGIAARRARKLTDHGIQTALDFAQADSRLIRSLLTVACEVLR